LTACGSSVENSDKVSGRAENNNNNYKNPEI